MLKKGLLKAILKTTKLEIVVFGRKGMYGSNYLLIAMQT
jgi:hypothetical protein